MKCKALCAVPGQNTTLYKNVPFLCSSCVNLSRGYAAAEANMEDDDQSSGEGSPLGIVPHQVIFT